MSVIKITDTLAVTCQPVSANFDDIAKQGFIRLLNLRPDAEDPEQLGNSVEAHAAHLSGLSYAFIPVSTSTISEADVRAFQKEINTSPGPVLAHCKDGTRALLLYVLGEILDGRMQPNDAEPFGKRYGFDLSNVKQWLKQQHKPEVKGFYDHRTGSIQYVISDLETKACAIIDPVLDFDEKSGSIDTKNADSILEYIQHKNLKVEWILDTHPHADHLSAAFYLKTKTGAPTAIGIHVTDVQKLWKKIYNLSDFPTDGSQWDHLFSDGDTFKIGNIKGSVIFSPGHTLASVTYVIGNAAFIHDTLFMPDSGTARTDFPGGSASDLWGSIQRILSLPNDTRLFTGHDYQPNKRNAKWESTVSQQKRFNPYIYEVDKSNFIKLREARDKLLPMPKLILFALQININGGKLPKPEKNGTSYLKIPINSFKNASW